MKNKIQAVGLNPNNYPQLTDHLAPLCAIMDIPLILTDEDYCLTIKPLYPNLKTVLLEWEEFTPRYLIENYDLLLQSEYWHRQEFYSKFAPLEEEYGKNIRNVHCPHGFSDKLRWFQYCVYEDITLVYGDNMLDMFKEMGILQHLNTYVRIGNYRYSYYLQNKNFYDAIANEKIKSRFQNNNPILLYAPSWHHEEDNSSIFESNSIYENLPSNYNLVVKIHPRQEETNAPALYRLMGKYEKKENILFITDLPVIYPLLNLSNVYIGDVSAIGYDFLSFNRPMFFLNQKKIDSKTDRRAFLNRCGIEILPEQYPNIYSIIESHLSEDQDKFSNARSEMYRYTFGDPVSNQDLSDSIINSYFSPKNIPKGL